LANRSVAKETRTRLNTLSQDLEEANRLFHTGQNGGREGTIHAVEAVTRYLMTTPQLVGKLSVLPVLQSALMSLDDGHTEPLLKATTKTGRARAGAIRECVVGNAVFTVQRLERTGMLTSQALAAVAAELNQVGIVTSRGRYTRVTARTVRGWRERVAQDVSGVAATTVGLLESIVRETRTDAEARRAYLTMLRGAVTAHEA
jgi:hypothetical protein